MKRTHTQRSAPSLLRALLLLASVAALPSASSCGKAGSEDTGSETHWLISCDSDRQCGEGSCECGVCSRSCTTASDCSNLRISGVECLATPSACQSGAKSSDVGGSLCLVACERDADCSSLGAGATCRAERCERPRGEVDAGGSAPINRFACGAAEPLIDVATGLERCEEGYLRRVGPATCPSTLPRAAAVPGYDPDVDECEYDAECSALRFGHCAPREGGRARICVAGCVSDQDCGVGRICACDDPVGRCVPATCTSGADCLPGFDCASYSTAGGGCFTTGFACQTPEDACGGDAEPECNGMFVNATFCLYEAERRRCSTEQCVTP